METIANTGGESGIKTTVLKRDIPRFMAWIFLEGCSLQGNTRAFRVVRIAINDVQTNEDTT